MSLIKFSSLNSLLIKDACKNSDNNLLTLKVNCRNFKVPPILLNRVITVYNGKKHVVVQVSAEMIGYTLGEFVATKVSPVFKTSNKRKT